MGNQKVDAYGRNVDYIATELLVNFLYLKLRIEEELSNTFFKIQDAVLMMR